MERDGVVREKREREKRKAHIQKDYSTKQEI